MKKYWISLFILLCIPAVCFGLAAHNMMMCQTASTSCTLDTEWDTGSDSTWHIGRWNTNEYGGPVWIPTSDVQICQVDLFIDSDVGDASVNDYYCEIWSMTNNDLNAVSGRSSKVDGDASWANEWVTFSFSTSVSVSSGVTCAIVFKALDDGDPAANIGEHDDTNYIRGEFDNEGNSSPFRGYWYWESSTNAYTSRDLEDDVYIKIYTMQ